MRSRFLNTAGSPPPRPDSGFFLIGTDDEEFDLLYPESIRRQSPCHWSPVDVCRLAATLLITGPGTRVLDIGCGPGKFCIIGAATTQGHFTGVEQREQLTRVATNLITRHGLRRAVIMHCNITEVNFRLFHAFYLFNPFMENIFTALGIDSEVELSSLRYMRYVSHVRRQLSQMPLGTRVVTYCGDCAEIPRGYACERTAFAEKLRLWVKRPTPPTRAAAGTFSQTKKGTCRRPPPVALFPQGVPHQRTAEVY